MLQGLYQGFPPEKLTAPAALRYIGCFYYCAYWKQWDEILDVSSTGEWTVREVGTDTIRKHRTPLWANRFADKPFN